MCLAFWGGKGWEWKEIIDYQRLFSPASIKVKETEDQKEERIYEDGATNVENGFQG